MSHKEAMAAASTTWAKEKKKVELEYTFGRGQVDRQTIFSLNGGSFF